MWMMKLFIWIGKIYPNKKLSSDAESGLEIVGIYRQRVKVLDFEKQDS